MTYEEAGALLGPEECARLTEFVEAAPPLTQRQAEILVALFRPRPAVSDAA